MEHEKNQEIAAPDKKKIALAELKKYAFITLGCLLYSLSITLFIEQANLTAGGMTGISLIINSLTGFDTGYLVIILNVPMFILGFIFLGWKFIVSTGYATVVSGLLMSLWKFVFGEKALNVLKYLSAPYTEPIVNAVFGAILFGISMGIIFRMGASTAGTDVIIKILHKKFRHIKTSSFSMMTDLIVVGSSFFTTNYDWNKLFYSVLVIIVFTFVFKQVLYGGDAAQMVFVISSKEKAEAICRRILTEVDSGVTYLHGEGAYTGEEKKVLFCVVKPYNYPHLRDIVAQEDKNAFTVVTSANEIYGAGYKSQDQEDV